ncbi:phage terminase large subunit family protein, partial [Sulfurimonas sp. SAG-AH-194-C20]
MKTARQVGKSTFLAAETITKSESTPHHVTFYASTSERQTKEFSNVKLTELLHRSPRMKEALLGDGANDSVFNKKFTNGSGVTMSYMKDDADRTRGYSADTLMLDEVQDMCTSEIPVVEEILSASLNPVRYYTGTPKTMDNLIEHKWSQSTMHEVFFKCSGCNSYNDIGRANIGKTGPICSKCGKNLDISHPIVLATRPSTNKDPYYLGIRIPQPALMLHTKFSDKWKDLLIKFETYEEAKFNNEVLGLSHSSGTRFITEDDLISIGTGFPAMARPTQELFSMFDLFVMGIDWSGDGQSFLSKNAAVVYGRRAGDPRQRLQVVYKKIFPKGDMIEAVDEMAMIADVFRCVLVGTDAGEGAMANAYLARRLGHERVQPFRYGAFSLPASLAKDKKTIYLDKTQALDDFFMGLKDGTFILPQYETIKEEMAHLLALFEVVSKSGRRVYSHSPAAP